MVRALIGQARLPGYRWPPTPWGALLGFRHPIKEATVQLAPGSTVVMYTDGLIEQRHSSITDGIDGP